MPVRDRVRLIVLAAGLAATLAAILGVLLTDQPLFGPLGAVALVVPPILLVDEIGGSRMPWPERALATLAAGLVLALLTSLTAALSPRGLDAAAVAVVQLGTLAAALLLWLPGRRARRRAAIHVHAHVAVAPATPRRPRPARAALVPLAYVVGGLALAAGGFGVATWAAQTQVHTGFVQLWSVPPSGGGSQVVAVRNEDGVALTCDLTLIRPGQPFLVGHVGTLADGQQWTTQLPAAQPGQTGPWQLSLSCTDPSGGSLSRQLTVNPPA